MTCQNQMCGTKSFQKWSRASGTSLFSPRLARHSVGRGIDAPVAEALCRFEASCASGVFRGSPAAARLLRSWVISLFVSASRLLSFRLALHAFTFGNTPKIWVSHFQVTFLRAFGSLRTCVHSLVWVARLGLCISVSMEQTLPSLHVLHQTCPLFSCSASAGLNSTRRDVMLDHCKLVHISVTSRALAGATVAGARQALRHIRLRCATTLLKVVCQRPPTAQRMSLSMRSLHVRPLPQLFHKVPFFLSNAISLHLQAC